MSDENIGLNKFQVKIKTLEVENGELKSNFEKMSQENSELNNKCNDYKLQLDKSSSRFDIVSSQLTMMNDSKNLIQQECDNFKENANRVMSELKSELSTVNNELNNVRINNSKLITDLDTLQQKFNEVKQTYKTSLQTITELNNKHDLLNTKFNETVEALNLYKSYDDDNKEKIRVLKEELSKKKNDHDVLKKQLDDKEVVLHQINTKLSKELSSTSINVSIPRDPKLSTRGPGRCSKPSNR